MEHLEFVDKLNKLGCSLRSTNIENKVKTIEVPTMGGNSEFVEIKNFQCSYSTNRPYSKPNALQALIIKAIDFDTWKHSWHNEINAENYEKFMEIIQEKILEKSKAIDFLTTIYFQLKWELNDTPDAS